MDYQFDKHYTKAEASALLPEIRNWLVRLRRCRDELAKYETRMTGLMMPDADLGGALVNSWVRAMADFQETGWQFTRRDIQIKDLDRGLLDFPAIIAGREVFLCWEEGEDDIEFWHDLDTGYAGREPL